MATILSVGDIAIVHYNSDTDSFSFVFLRDVEAGTTLNFTDNGWLAASGFRAGENTVTYTAPSAIAAGTIVTLSGLDLDAAGDQIIAYQGVPATPTILHVIDFADGNNTVAGDATNDNATALPPGFTLGVNAVAVAFDNSLYAGPTSGSRTGLFAALNNSANWLDDDALPVPFIFNAKPTIDLDSDNSTHTGQDYEASATSGGPGVPVADADSAISDDDGSDIFAAEFRIVGVDVRDLLTINGTLPDGIVAAAYRAPDGILRLEGQASHAAYAAAIRQVEFSTSDTPGDQKRIHVSVFDGQSWSKNSTAFIHVTNNLTATPPRLDLDANDSSGGGADATATYTAGGPAKSVTDSDVLITDDGTTIQSATITILGWARNLGDTLSVAGSLPGGITASTYSEITGVLTLSGPASLADYQTALHQVVYSNTLAAPSTADRGIQVTVDDGGLTSNITTMYMHVVVPPPNTAPVLDLDADNSTTPGANYLTGFTEGGPPVAIADTDISIIDPDSPNLASATITLTNPQTDDVLTFGGTPPAGIVVSGSGTAAITLTGVALSGSYQSALQQIKFSNGNVDPSNVTRTIEVVVSDGASSSNTATAVIQVEAVNNSAPVVDLDPDDSGGSVRTTFRTTFTENGTPIPIADTDTIITDLDSTTLVSATITLANQHPGDLLTVAPLPGGIVASSYDPGTGVLTLTGLASLDEYEAALQLVLYGNTSDNPVTEDRLIEVVVNDGANTSNVAATLIGVVAVNDAPALHVDTAAVYVENAAAIALSPLATLTDVDDTELNDLVVRITGGGIAGDGDTLTVGGSTSGTINGITFLWDPAEHAMVLTGASLVANYQDLLRTVAFHSTSDNPTDFNASSARTLTWSVSGGTAVTTATTTLNIVAVNDAPQATIVLAASYTENGAPVVLSPASTATDVDDIDLVAGEVRIVSGAVGGDLLTVNGLQSGTFSGIDFSYDSVLHSLTFTRPAAVADYQAFLQAVAFSSTSDDPTNSGLSPTRTLSWFLFDGAALSNVQATVVSITAVADPPVNTVPGAQSINEDTALPIAGVSVADADSATLTTTLTVASGKLNLTASPGVTGNGTATVTITGTPAEINTALAGLSYSGNLNFNGFDSLTVTTSDGAASDIDTVAITVNAVNDRPVLDLDANNSSGAAGADYTTSFTEGGAAVAIADLDDLITDVDNSDLASATITLANHQPADVLSITGTLPAGITASAYDPATGVLTLSGAATLATYQAALRQVAFGNSSPTPSATDRIVNIVVNDGAASSVAAHAFVHVIPLDTAPALDLDADDSSGAGGADYTAVFTGGGAAVPIADTDTLIADADSPSLVAATIKLTSGEAGDLLSVNGTLPTGITSTFDPLTGILTLTGSASRADYQTALRQIAYDSSDPNPLTATRVIEVTVNDGSTDSNAAFSQIQVALAAPPTLDLDADDSTAGGSDYATAFTEDGAAVRIADTDVIISTSTLVSATITLTNLLPGDVLSVSGTLPAGITSAYDEVSGVLTLTGEASAAGYQAASDEIVYSNSDPNPSTDPRIITVVVNDGISDSNTATAIVHVAAVNDPPSLSVAPAASYVENDPAVLVSPAVTVSDPDNPTLTIGVVAITAGLTPGDVLTVSGLRSGALGPIKFDWAPSLNELIVTGTGSPGDYEALFQSVRFHSDSDDPTNGGADTTRTISWAVFDGTNTAVSTTTLTISALNDAAVARDGSTTGDEDKPIAGTLVATDTDGITLTYSLAAPAAHGSVVLRPDGSYTYTPAADFNGSDSFTFVANDGETDSNVAIVTLTVSPVSDRPPGQRPGGNPVPTPGFDAGYYLATNPDVAAAGVDPLEHFNTVGWREGRNPSASFDMAYYLAQNPDVAVAGVNPLDHFNSFGWREGRDPNPYFDTTGYLEHYADVAAAGVNPLQHYEEFGWHEGRDPSLAFDTTQYLAVYTDVAAAHTDPLGHFLYFGIREGRSPFGDGFWE